MQLLHHDETLSESPLSYFRHKGIKVKFTDIENAIADYPYISGSVVVCNEDSEGNRRLVAYIISSGTFNQHAVTSFLTDKLKPFMIPAVWVCVDAFPLTQWGSINKNALCKLQLTELKRGEFVAPQNEKELKLAHIIQNILKLDSISINDNFFRLGGGSLQALRVIAAIRKELHANVDIKYFFLYPTIAELAGYLDGLYFINNAGVIHQRTFQEPVLQNSSIIPIKATGKRAPLYIVSGGGGTAFTFAKFAYMLGEDQPVYGFQHPTDASELGKFPDTIEAIAAKYVKEMLMIDPNGPYALSGHCIGGAIALEMARILQTMGKEIQLLAMFDVLLTDEQEHIKKEKIKGIDLIKKTCNSTLEKIEFETYLLFRHTKDALDYKWENIKVFLNKFHQFWKEDTDYLVFTQFEKMFESAYANYKVKRFSGEILVFYAKDHYRFVDKDRNIRYKKHTLSEDLKNRWKNYAGNVKIFEVDGEHSSIFEPIYASNFAGLLQQHLRT